MEQTHLNALTRGVCVICRQAPLDDLRAHQCASTLHKESPHLSGSLLMKKETQECVSSFLHHYVCIKRIPTAALSASGCGSKRSASSQPANSPAPHILSNSLTTSIPLSDRNINIFFCDVTPYAATHY